ncbi:MAG: restriction endonuclease subunit S [Patescibacteria group bacterium]|jgi:type I restriction enzyme S subunit
MTKVSIKKEYKASGVDWLGDIPAEWDVHRGKFIFRNRKEINDRLQCENVLSLTMRGVISREELGEGGLLPASYATFQVFYPKNLVFKLIDLENYKTSRVGLVPQKGIMSSAYVRLVAIDDTVIDTKFAYYFYYNLYLQGIYNFLGMGVRSTLGPWDLLEVSVLIPPLETQRRIADFLDEKTKIIDELIAKKKKLIELLREKRAVLVTRAVTKGLDPNAKLKPSGIDWLGNIPEGWEIAPLKKVIKSRMGGAWGESEAGGKNDVICVRVADFDYDNLSISNKSLTLRNFSNLKKHLLLNKRSILLEKSGGGEKHLVGRAVSFTLNERAICSNFIEKMEIASNYLSRHIAYLFAGLYVIKVNGKAIKQTTGIQNLDLHYFLQNLVPLAPIEIQEQIADFLDAETAKINKAITFIEPQVEKLKEYRSSLIYHAVTGKIKV